jgi:uncharacterized lipoprotein YbaY
VSEHDDRLVRRVVGAAGGRDAAEPCPDAELLGLYAERQLDGAELAGVETHVAGCTRCQATLAAFVRSAPDGIEAPGAFARAGAGDAGAAWWSGWKWLVPLAATAAVVTMAVWVQRPDVPDEMVVQEQTAAEAAAMRPPVQSERAGTADPAGAAPGASAPAAASDRSTQAPAETGPVGSALRSTAPSAPPAASALADAGGRTAAAAPPPAPVSTMAETRQEAVAAAAPDARAKGLAAAGAREADAVADARERSAPAAPVPPPPPAAVAPAAPREAEAFARRQAESVEANRADSAAPAQAKVGAGQESPARATARGALGATAVAAPAKRPAQLTGRVTYRTRAALPAGAIVDVRLLDVSRADAPAVMVGRVEIVTRGEQVPLPFTIAYDAAAIDARFRYTVQVTITVGGRVAYRTTTAHPVLTSGAPATNVEVVVEPMR